MRTAAQVGALLLGLTLAACSSAPSGSGTPASPAPTPMASPDSTLANPADVRDIAAWKDVALPGKRLTQYQVGEKDGRWAWEAQADQSASMVRKQVYVAPADLGEVRFSWWVSDLLTGADLAERGQGDSPARVIFAFDGDHQQLSMRNRMVFEMANLLSGEPMPYATLMYVWSNEAAVDSVILNPRTDRVRKIVLESGPAHLRQWRDYRRQLADDFRRAFGEEPGPLIGVALMTDTDNTATATRSWYGDIVLGAAPRVAGQAPAQPTQP